MDLVDSWQNSIEDGSLSLDVDSLWDPFRDEADDSVQAGSQFNIDAVVGTSCAKASLLQQLPVELWGHIFRHLLERQSKANLRLSCRAADTGFCAAPTILEVPSAKDVSPSPARYTHVRQLHLTARFWNRGLRPESITNYLSSLLAHSWPNVTTIVSHGCLLPSGAIILISLCCPNLTSLHLALNPNGSEALDTLTTIPEYLPNLTALDISRPGHPNRLHISSDLGTPANTSSSLYSSTDPAQLQGLTPLTKLQTLTLQLTGCGRRSSSDLRPLQHLPSLSNLTLITPPSHPSSRADSRQPWACDQTPLIDLTSLTCLRVVAAAGPGDALWMLLSQLLQRPSLCYPRLRTLILDDLNCTSGVADELVEMAAVQSVGAAMTKAAAGIQAATAAVAEKDAAARALLIRAAGAVAAAAEVAAAIPSLKAAAATASAVAVRVEAGAVAAAAPAGGQPSAGAATAVPWSFEALRGQEATAETLPTTAAAAMGLVQLTSLHLRSISPDALQPLLQLLSSLKCLTLQHMHLEQQPSTAAASPGQQQQQQQQQQQHQQQQQQQQQQHQQQHQQQQQQQQQGGGGQGGGSLSTSTSRVKKPLATAVASRVLPIVHHAHLTKLCVLGNNNSSSSSSNGPATANGSSSSSSSKLRRWPVLPSVQQLVLGDDLQEVEAGVRQELLQHFPNAQIVSMAQVRCKGQVEGVCSYVAPNEGPKAKRVVHIAVVMFLFCQGVINPWANNKVRVSGLQHFHNAQLVSIQGR